MEALFLRFESFSEVNDCNILYHKRPDTIPFVTSENFSRAGLNWSFFFFSNTVTPGLLNVTRSCLKLIHLPDWFCLFSYIDMTDQTYIYERI